MNTPDIFMARALALARQADARVEPNPRVGAVVVLDGRIVGEGYHAQSGQPHAEAMAIRAAGPLARGADLYVTLEPCNHHGRTPPCTLTILAAGIRSVFVGARDPNPQVAGHGLDVLRAAGLSTTWGVAAAEATDLIAPFTKVHRTGLPYITLKWAMSLDGRTGTVTGDSKWITSEATRAAAHVRRAQYGAILVGIGTALADNPRLLAAQPDHYTPLRVLLDRHARLPQGSVLCSSARQYPVLVAVSAEAPAERTAALEACGCAVLRSPLTAGGGIDLPVLCRALARQGHHSLLVEGGPTVAASFLAAGLVDEVHAYIAPVILGGRNTPGPVAGDGAQRIAEALRGKSTSMERHGEDWLLRVRLDEPGASR